VFGGTKEQFFVPPFYADTEELNEGGQE